MQTVLNHKSPNNLTPSQAYLNQKAELAAHNAAVAIANELSGVLPDDLKCRAIPCTLIGLVSAFGRILATFEDQNSAGFIAKGMSDVMPMELEYWRTQRGK